MSRTCILLASVVVLGISACASPQHGRSGDPVVVPARLAPDGALQFDTADDFFVAVDAVTGRASDQLDAWERSVGFLSMRRGFAELQAQLDATPADQRDAVLAGSADLVDPASTAGEPVRRVRPTVYAALVDRQGILYIGDAIYKATATELLIARGGNRQTFDAWLDRRPEPSPAFTGARADTGGVESIPYVATAPVTSAPPSAMASASVVACNVGVGGSAVTSDRREDASTFMYSVMANPSPGVYQFQLGYEWDMFPAKKNLLGQWVTYATTFQTYNSSLAMDAFKVTVTGTPNYQFVYQRYDLSFPDHDSPEATSATLASGVGDIIQMSFPITPAFRLYALHFESTTRGTFPTRLVLDRTGCCGDGVCQAQLGESETTCAADCTRCPSGVCSALENVSTCYADCHCGDGACEPEESPFTCPADCGPPPCDPTHDICPVE